MVVVGEGVVATCCTKQLRPEKKSCWADSNSGESKSHATANRNKKASSYVASKHAERKRNNSPASFQGGRLLLDADGVFADPHAGSVNDASIDRGGLDVNTVVDGVGGHEDSRGALSGNDGRPAKEDNPHTVVVFAVRFDDIVLVLDPVVVPCLDGQCVVDPSVFNPVVFKAGTFELRDDKAEWA